VLNIDVCTHACHAMAHDRMIREVDLGLIKTLRQVLVFVLHIICRSWSSKGFVRLYCCIWCLTKWDLANFDQQTYCGAHVGGRRSG